MTVTTIANGWDGLYAALTMPKKSDTTAEERAALRERVHAGEWLRIGDAAKALGISRSKVDLLMKAGTITYRLEPSSRYRQVSPTDIVKLLDEARRERRGEAEIPASEAAPTHTATVRPRRRRGDDIERAK